MPLYKWVDLLWFLICYPAHAWRRRQTVHEMHALLDALDKEEAAFTRNRRGGHHE